MRGVAALLAVKIAFAIAAWAGRIARAVLRLTWRGSGQGPYRGNICGSPASVRYPSL